MAIMPTLRRLHRELRYRELPIVNRPVVIESLDHVEHVLRQLATPWLSRDPVWDGCDVMLGLAKYGLVDRSCEVDPRHLEGGLAGVRVLRGTGFAAGPGADAETRAFAGDCLEMLADSLGRCVLKLFLEDRLPDDDRRRHNMPRFQAGLAPSLLPDYFPRGFVVTDACITNASGIWLNKHFYL